MDKVIGQIADLRNLELRKFPDDVMDEAADTMEAMLKVVEAARAFLDSKDKEGRFWPERQWELEAALAELDNT